MPSTDVYGKRRKTECKHTLKTVGYIPKKTQKKTDNMVKERSAENKVAAKEIPRSMIIIIGRLSLDIGLCCLDLVSSRPV